MLSRLLDLFARPGVPPRLRFMSRGFVRWPASVLALLLAGLVIVGEISRLGAEDFSQGTSGFGADALETPDARTPAPSGATPGGPSPSASASGSPPASPTPSGSPGGSPSPGPGPGPGGGFAWTAPSRGTYTYRLTGQEDVSLVGPACRRRYAQGRITVVPLGEDLQLDTEYVNADGSVTHRERRIVNYSDTGVRVEYTEASVFCIQQRNAPAEYSPALLLYRFPLAVGSVWTSHAESENRSTDLTGEVLRTETVSAAGRTFETYVIKTLITFTGRQTGERSDTWWFAPSLGLPVKWEERTEARQGPATFRSNGSWLLTRTP